MDFIEQLPESQGFMDILVVVDRLTKQAVFIPTQRSINATELVKIFVRDVFSKHGALAHVTSDRGSEFVSRFFKALLLALDIRLHFTSGYHPEADGQTERTNQTLEQYLRIYCNYQQSDWVQLLPLAEFTYNNTTSLTTEFSPFFANKGYHPHLDVHPDRAILSDVAHQYSANLKEVHTQLKISIGDAQARYKRAADNHRVPAPEINIGDRVFVLAKPIRTTCPSRKLAERYLGPFEVTDRPGSLSYRVNLPEHLRAIHPVFHVSQLEPAPISQIPNRVETPPPPIELDGALEFEVAQVLDSKLDNRRSDPLMYYVRWLGYEGTAEEYSWLTAADLTNATRLVAKFHRHYPNKPGPPSTLLPTNSRD